LEALEVLLVNTIFTLVVEAALAVLVLQEFLGYLAVMVVLGLPLLLAVCLLCTQVEEVLVFLMPQQLLELVELAVVVMEPLLTTQL
jgi:hypothetical protein